MFEGISVLLGKTLKDVKRIENEEIIFTLEDGTEYTMYHRQDCCEGVYIEDINGDLNDLVGSPITLAEANTSSDYQEWEKKIIVGLNHLHGHSIALLL